MLETVAATAEVWPRPAKPPDASEDQARALPAALSGTLRRAADSTAGEAKGVSTRGFSLLETYLFRVVGREQKLTIDAAASS